MSTRSVLNCVGRIVVISVFLLSTFSQVQAVSVSGQQKGIFLLVEFPDIKHSITFDSLRRTADALVNYYREQSFGKLLLLIDIEQHWHMASKSASFYHIDDLSFPTGDTYRIQLIKETLSLAGPDFNISSYDFIIIIHPQTTQFDISWAYNPAWGSGAYWCSKGHPLFCSTKIALDTEHDRGTIFHETGHLLGLPDLYDQQAWEQGKDKNTYVDSWDLMGGDYIEPSPMGLSAWSRMKLDWIPENQITNVVGTQKANITLVPLESGNGTLVIKIYLELTKYYIIEYRQKVGYDRNLPGAGVIVYLADDSLGSGQGPLRLAGKQPLGLTKSLSENNVTITLLKLTPSSALIAIITSLGGHALDAIKQADIAIQRAKLEDRSIGLDAAIQLLSDARQAYSSGDYAQAYILAWEAQTIAEAARMTTTNSATTMNQQTTRVEPLSPLFYYAIPTLIAISVAIAALFRIRGRRRRETQISSTRVKESC